MPVPVQIHDQGRLIRFRSKKVFLDLMGWSHTYTMTSHYKKRYGEETLQQLWDRTTKAHDRLDAFMKANRSEFDASAGMRSFKKGRVIVYPVGYTDIADPQALKDLDAQALRPNMSANGGPVASGPIVSHTVFDAMMHCFIDKTADEIASKGAEAFVEVHALYDSIRALQLDESQRRIVSINDDPKHALVAALNEYLAENGVNSDK